MAETVRALVEIGIPVMGHLGLTPQSVHALGGYRVQGREADAGRAAAGRCEGARGGRRLPMVLELVPAALAGEIIAALADPDHRHRRRPGCDGQVLVLHDMLGLNEGFTPKFLKRYADLADAVRAGRDGVRRRGARRDAIPGRSTASSSRQLPSASQPITRFS